MARQVTALPGSLTLRQARRFRNLAVRYATANPREPLAQLWADHATLVCAEQLDSPNHAFRPGVEPAAPAIDLREIQPDAPEEPELQPEAVVASISGSYSDEVLLAAILHNGNA
ncbi:MAG: hypothetical protein GY698_01875 [Actinomycetia bacterium]|nr:hypothetical protein [Actinomycetes bacterium]